MNWHIYPPNSETKKKFTLEKSHYKAMAFSLSHAVSQEPRDVTTWPGLATVKGMQAWRWFDEGSRVDI